MSIVQQNPIAENNQPEQTTIRVGLSDAFLNKTNLTGQQKAFSHSFVPSEVTLQHFIDHVLSGKAFTLGYFSCKSRRKDTFVSSQLLALDFDNGVSVAQAKAHPFIAAHAFLIYPTPSSTPEHPKTRVLFRLSEPVTEVGRWEALQRGLLAYFADWQPDEACKDAARLFYGSTQPGAEVIHA